MTGYTDTFSAIVDRTDQAAVVQLFGELDLASAAELQGCLGELLASTGSDVAVFIDLGDLSFCDSTGISALVRAANAAKRDGRRLALRRPRPGVRRVLEITGVISMFEIED